MTEDLNKQPNKTMYLLYHIYEYGDNKEHENIKMLGIYSSEERALDAVERYYKLDGFKEYPKECFETWEMQVDVDFAWNEGFTNSYEIEQDFELLTICFNEWLNIKETPQDSWKREKYYNALCEIHEKVYSISDVIELAEYIQQIWMKRFGDKSKNFYEYIKIAGKIQKSLSIV